MAREFVVPRLVDAGDWVADHERSVCGVCSRPFGAFRRKHHCRMCGEIVCNNCTLQKESVADPAAGRTRVRVCISCVCAKPPRAASASRRPQQLDSSRGDPQKQLFSAAASPLSPRTEASDDLSSRQWLHQQCLHSPTSSDGVVDDDRHVASAASSSSSADSIADAWRRHMSDDNQRPDSPVSRRHSPVPRQQSPVVHEQSPVVHEQSASWSHAWPQPPVPSDEAARLDALLALNVLDSAPEKPFDLICDLAKARLSCPMAAVGFLDEHRQWFKASVGLAHKVIPRAIAFCAYPVFLKEPVVVLDTLKDPRFEHNPLVAGAAAVRFYAAAPVLDPATGHALGSVFVLDTRPRESCDIAVLERLAHAASENLPSLTALHGDDDVDVDDDDASDSEEVPVAPQPTAKLLLGDKSEASALSVSTASLSSEPSRSGSPARASPSRTSNNNNARAEEAEQRVSTQLEVLSKAGGALSAPQMESMLMRLLTQSTETQQQLAVQQISISELIGQHTSQINKLMSDLARMEAKMESAKLS